MRGRRRGRGLKAREESLKIRRQNRRSLGGYDVLPIDVTGIVAMFREETNTDTGVLEASGTYRINISPPVAEIEERDEIVRLKFLTDTSDDGIRNAKKDVLLIVDKEVHDSVQQLLCQELSGRTT